MNTNPPFAWKWWSIGAVLLSGWLPAGERAGATGYNGPSAYLENGGQVVDKAPEFYWELEVKRLARAFHPADAPAIPPGVFPPVLRYGDEDDPSAKHVLELTEKHDLADFAAALKAGRIKPPNAAEAQKQHEAARDVLTVLPAKTIALEAEFPSEFADYHRGAYAFRQGEEHYAEARKAWEALLARPAAERHYRSVWAAFMLGKLGLKEGKAEAVQMFQKTRALAREGFADSLGMAADSYGWEGRSEWKQGHPEKAAPLFLTQLALGDESAVVSLKALIPDREAQEGLLNYGPDDAEVEKWTDAEKKAADQKKRAGLRAMAADPLLRRLETVHILATETALANAEESSAPEPRESRIARWFSLLHEAGIKDTEEAEYLGFAAYGLGDYQGAARWLGMVKTESGVAHWLRAKLQRREGKMEEAAKSMLLAWQALHTEAGYTGWKPAPSETPPGEETEPDPFFDENWSFSSQAGGNLGCFMLARGEFLQAFDAFHQGKMWEDASFVAESILTVDELKGIVDKATAEAPPVKPENQGREPDHNGDLPSLRWLLGRRLVRVDRYAEAGPYLPAPYDKVLGVYVQALEDGANAKLDKTQRARAWFKAAWIARYDGMELMGTETAPDGFITGGDFESYPIAEERRSGKVTKVEEDANGKEKKTVKPVALKVSKEELARLNKFRGAPEVRWHYRVIAGVLAMKAAALLPDNTPELADVINTAGNWVKDRDNKAADQYYLTLQQRAGKTAIGRAAHAKKWFVDQDGPWNERETAEHAKLMPAGQ